MAQYRLKQVNKECPICGKMIYYHVGDDTVNVTYIKSKRGSENVYHNSCLEEVRRLQHESDGL